jgi:ribosome biogenesis SPOUT family RNA methylase Rps3
MKGRTEKLITRVALKKLRNVMVRNLGKVQLPIDQAAIVAKLIMEGKKLEQIEIAENLRITLEEEGDLKRVVELPYGYVIINKKPAITKEFVEFLKEGWEF